MSLTECSLPQRSLPIGAEVIDDEGANFRVWAPEHTSVTVFFDTSDQEHELIPEGNGYFSGTIATARAGSRYKYLVDCKEPCPDPASRFQPDGPHGFSEIIDPGTFRWTDADWPGVRLKGQVIYELHLGTFTTAGTWTGAAEKLEYLRDTGITVIEIMPIADFPGKFGWGYDGVGLFAPVAIYGTPNEMRQFVDRAHSLGLGVILDVVYNHLGPDGNYLTKFSSSYFNEGHKTDWGTAINFDGPCSEPVRDFYRSNAAYWIREFHLDGLRLDATQDIHDESPVHILREIGCAARQAAGNRSIILVGENEPQETKLIRPIAEGGYGLDALWNDDYHHTAIVALTGKADAYYRDYKGTPQELLSATKHGYLYQGQWYRWQEKPRGTSTFGIPRPAMINFIQNHDQVANSARGQRIHELSSPGNLKAITALTLLSPGTPMLLQGQEFAASAPFLYFADHTPGLAEQVRLGRIDFLKQWRGLQLPEMQACFADPKLLETFERCVLNYSDLNTHKQAYSLHRDLLRLRRKDPIISAQGEYGLDGAVLSNECFIVRFFSGGRTEDRLLVVNLGMDLEFDPAPEPLLAPPQNRWWTKLFSTEDPQYGGCGTPPLDTGENWIIPGQAAVLLRPESGAAEPSQ